MLQLLKGSTMIPPFLHFHAVVTKLGALFHHPLTIGGQPNADAANKQLKNMGYDVKSMHGSYDEAGKEAERLNAAAAPVANDSESIAEDAIKAPAIA
jgi:hypothetical protein